MTDVYRVQRAPLVVFTRKAEAKGRQLTHFWNGLSLDSQHFMFLYQYDMTNLSSPMVADYPISKHYQRLKQTWDTHNYTQQGLPCETYCQHTTTVHV